MSYFKYATELKYIMQAYRNYEMFKEALTRIVSNDYLSEEEADKNYLYMKGRLYGLKVDDFINNIPELEKEINYIESTENLIESRRESYYMRKI